MSRVGYINISLACPRAVTIPLRLFLQRKTNSAEEVYKSSRYIPMEIIRKTTSVKIDNVRLFARLFDRLRLKLITFVQFAKFNICARNLQQYCVPLVAEDLYSVLTNNEVD